MTAEDLRKSILQQAIQGKLVPQDPNDEPASKLLERIREEKARLVKEKKIKKDKNESIIFRGDDNSHYEKILATGEVKCIDDEIPFEIPESWAWCRLGEVLTVKGGKRLPLGASFSNEPTPYIYIRVTEMKNGTLIDNNLKYISHEIFEQIKNYTISKNDLYLTIAGTIGSVGIVPEKFDGMNLTENAVKLTNILVEKYYLLHIISSSLVQNQFVDKTKQVAQPKLAIERIITTLIPLPPLSEQKRIVARIEELMSIVDKFEKAKIELNQLESELQPLLKKSILQYAIQGKLVPQNLSDEPASELLKRIEVEKEKLIKAGKIKRDKNSSVIFKGDDNKYYEKVGNEITCIDNELPFEIPDSWEWVRFRNIAKFSLGKTPDRVDSSFWNSNDIPWISIADMEDKSILITTKEYISQKALAEKFGNVIVPIGTLIMSFKLTIGKVSILGIDAVHNEAIISIYPYISDNNITRDFLFNFLSIITGYTSSTDAIKGATLNSKKISEMFVPLPPLKEQQRIVERLDNILKGIEGI